MAYEAFPNAPPAVVDSAVGRFGSDERGLNRAMVFLLESGEGAAGLRRGGRGGAAAAGGVVPPEDEEEDDDKWEPPSGLLGSRLDLRELDMLHKADSFDASNENFQLPPGWSEAASAAESPIGALGGMMGQMTVGGGGFQEEEGNSSSGGHHAAGGSALGPGVGVRACRRTGYCWS